ncbi:hypothetical protein UlMin_043774 [Ulmus minor]
MDPPFVEGGENRRALRDYAAPCVTGTISGIRRPTIQANNFEIKPSFITMVQANQFGGMSKDDPNSHISYFLEVCDLYKQNGMLRKCPHHGIPVWLRVSTFYNGLVSFYRAMIDAVAGGSLMGKTPEEAHELLETMADKNNQWHSDWVTTRRPAGVQKLIR